MYRTTAFLLFLALSFTCHAQTTVTGTIVDPNGNSYANGTASAYTVATSGQPTTSTSPVATNGAGFFTLSLPANTYVFTICAPPVPLGPTQNPTPAQICFISSPIAISGGSQDISAQLNALAKVIGPNRNITSNAVAPISRASIQAGATADVQISNAISTLAGGSGIVWADYSTNQTWAACPTWGSGNVTVVLFPITYTYSGTAATCTIPANIALEFYVGALISPSNTKTVNIQGQIIGGAQQLFSNAIAGQGTIDLTGNVAVQKVYPEWWGAVSGGNGTTNLNAIQAAIIGAYGSNRSNGSPNLVYNRELHFSGLYNVSGTLNLYHINGFVWTGEGRLTSGLIEGNANTTLINSQSLTYGTFRDMQFSTTASQNLSSPLFSHDYTGAQGADLAPQFVTFYDVNWIGSGTSAIGYQLAPSGGGSQGSNIQFITNVFSSFSEAGLMIGAGSSGSCSAIATNAISITVTTSDFISNHNYGIENCGAGNLHVINSTAENGFATQTGCDIYSQIGSAGEITRVDTFRSESLVKFCGVGPFYINGAYNTDQGVLAGSGVTVSTGAIIQGSASGPNGGVYYRVSAGGTFGGLGTSGSPRSASGGSANTLVDSVGGLTVNAWTGWSVSILSGTGAYTYCIVASNTATTFTCSSGAFLTNFSTSTDLPAPNVTISTPDATTRYIVEPNWGSQTTSGTVTWGNVTQSESGLAYVDGMFTPGIQILNNYPSVWHDVQVTRADWLTGSNLMVDGGMQGTVQRVMVGVPSGGTGAGSARLGVAPLRTWAFLRHAPFVGLSNISVDEKFLVPVCWGGGVSGGGTAHSDVCISIDSPNGNLQIINNSGGTPANDPIWTWRKDGSQQFPSVSFSNLPSPPNGSQIYCSDCNSTCTGGGSTGRTCFRENGAWTRSIIASGTATLGTSAISSGTCATVVTVSAPGVLSTDTLSWSPSSDISGVTGYNPGGGLLIYQYPTANNVNFKVCNSAAGSVTPGSAIVLNWTVPR